MRNSNQLSLNQIRKHFLLNPEYIHLSINMLSPHSLPVRQAIDQHRRQLNRNPALYVQQKDYFEQRVLHATARYLATEPQFIALTESTTMGLGIIYSGLSLNPGEEILTTTHEHYATAESLRFKAQASGAALREITLYENAATQTAENLTTQIINAITPATRIVALTWVHSCSGLKLPIQAIAAKIQQINAKRADNEQILLCVDGLHALGIENFSVTDLGCDFFIAGCHKALLGPRGTGFVWGKPSSWDKISPIIPSFSAPAFSAWLNQQNPELTCPKAWFIAPGGFSAFEHRWALAEAFDYHFALGKEKIQQHIHKLSQYCIQSLQKIPEAILHTSDNIELASGIICFEIAGIDNRELIRLFQQHKVLIGLTPYRRPLPRFMLCLYNSKADIDIAIDLLKQIISQK